MLKMICLNMPSVDQNIVSKHMLFFVLFLILQTLMIPITQKMEPKWEIIKKKIKIKIKKIEVL